MHLNNTRPSATASNTAIEWASLSQTRRGGGRIGRSSGKCFATRLDNLVLARPADVSFHFLSGDPAHTDRSRGSRFRHGINKLANAGAAPRSFGGAILNNHQFRLILLDQFAESPQTLPLFIFPRRPGSPINQAVRSFQERETETPRRRVDGQNAPISPVICHSPLRLTESFGVPRPSAHSPSFPRAA